MRAIDRWADAFIAVCAGERRGEPRPARLSGAALAAVTESLAVLRAAAAVFERRLRYRSGAAAARTARGALERALAACGYAGGSRGVETALSLFALLVRKNHGAELGRVCAEIEARAKKRAGILGVIVETPEAAGADFLEALRAALLRKTGAAGVEFEERVAPELIGGCRVILGGERLDFSVRGGLRRFEKSLLPGGR